ncbi:gamma-aminobutyric acid receptor-associated protein-like 2 [Lethenteron reissneri]|uniref:gamma-aminobutyric acid receptor-associated protein-like 2 n=1 Tax=Lethenteron reissneri TaxID=7753 RepID=UPI002AB70281|nr:gamma-aminobutyric acid receptor-associated protein-like 2 [Lethenteron reissneri]
MKTVNASLEDALDTSQRAKKNNAEKRTLRHSGTTLGRRRKRYSCVLAPCWDVYVQVVVEKVPGSQIGDIDKRKYLVPADITVAQFMWIIRKRVQLPSDKAIFLFIDKTVPQSSASIGQLYEDQKDEDGFLYVAYSGENTFGR